MPVPIRCEDPYCQMEFLVDESQFGDRTMCPRCWEVFPVPANGPPPLTPPTLTSRISWERMALIGLLALSLGLIAAILTALDIFAMESSRANTRADVLLMCLMGPLLVAWFVIALVLWANGRSFARTFKEVVEVDKESEPVQWSRFAEQPLHIVLGAIIAVDVATLIVLLFRMAP